MKKNERWQELSRKEKEAMELFGTAIYLGLVIVAGFAVAWGWFG